MQIVPSRVRFAFFGYKTISYIATPRESLVKTFNCNVLKKFSCICLLLLLTLNLDFRRNDAKQSTGVKKTYFIKQNTEND